MLKNFFFISLCIWSTQSASCGELADKRCMNCEVANVCDDCFESTWDATSKTCKVPATKLDKCFVYSNETTCRHCHFGYYPSAGKCIKMPVSGCAMANDTTPEVCMGCFDQKLVSMDYKSCTTNKCSDSNCLVCTQFLGNQMCVYCKKGWIAGESGNCLADTKNEYISHQGNAECRLGYYMNKNVCTASDLITEPSFSTSFSNLLGLFIFTIANSFILA
jgi:hypothetical protein